MCPINDRLVSDTSQTMMYCVAGAVVCMLIHTRWTVIFTITYISNAHVYDVIFRDVAITIKDHGPRAIFATPCIVYVVSVINAISIW